MGFFYWPDAFSPMPDKSVRAAPVSLWKPKLHPAFSRLGNEDSPQLSAASQF
jgi:hypothetical protein